MVAAVISLLIGTTSSQGAYKSGKPGNLREFCNSGKLREFEMYSGNFSQLGISSAKQTADTQLEVCTRTGFQSHPNPSP